MRNESKTCVRDGTLTTGGQSQNVTNSLSGASPNSRYPYGGSENQNLRNLKISIQLCVVVRFFVALPLDYDLTIGFYPKYYSCQQCIISLCFLMSREKVILKFHRLALLNRGDHKISNPIFIGGR